MKTWFVMVQGGSDSRWDVVQVNAETPEDAAVKITEPHVGYGEDGATVYVVRSYYVTELQLKARRGFEAHPSVEDVVESG